MWHRMGLINHDVQSHHKTLGEILDNEIEMAAIIKKNSELADYIATFAVDMAGLLVDLMADVHQLAALTGHPEIGERIDARADIAAAMLKLQSEWRMTIG